MELIPAKTIVTHMKNQSWFGADYNMNIYRGCSHGCIYCDSRSDCYRVEDFGTVRAKRDAVGMIGRELASKRSKGVIATGSMSDPYNPMEKKYELTRAALMQVRDRRFGIGIATKSDLVVRDIDVLKEIQEHMPVIVKVTVTTADDLLCARIEPGVAAAGARFAAIEEMARAGIYTGVLMMPVLPFIEDNEDNILAIVHGAARHGARFVYPGLGVTMRDSQREWYYERLDALFPGLSKKYAARFGDRYSCGARNAQRLYDIFRNACGKLGLAYKMEEIVREYRSGYEQKQLSFF